MQLKYIGASYLAIILIARSFAFAAENPDLVVDGVNQTITGGVYRNIVVKNNATFNVTGPLAFDTLLVAADAKLTVAGALSGKNLLIESATANFNGRINNVEQVNITGGTTTIYGVWNSDNFFIRSGATVTVLSVDSKLTSAGTLHIICNAFLLEANARLDGFAAGNDPRGQGHDWYADSDGGGNGGQGGTGFWGSSHGNEGKAFGSAFSYEAPMGGAGGMNGGAGIMIVATSNIVVDGLITVDGSGLGGYGHGGGGGGTILLNAPIVSVKGTLTAKGGKAGENSGGGGGGRIKIFYQTLEFLGSIGPENVAGGIARGPAGGTSGADGTRYFDALPRVTDIIGLLPGTIVPESSVLTFSFRVEDLSGKRDGHNDSLTPLLEISADGFTNILKAFDQSSNLDGWDKLAYYSEDTISFSPRLMLDPGVYSWRVSLRDQSLFNQPTEPITFTVGNAEADVNTLAITMTPTVLVFGKIGQSGVIEYAESPDGQWLELGELTITASPMIYYDTTGTSKTKRFYRFTPK